MTLEYKIVVTLKRKDKKDDAYRSEMNSIHKQLETWLRERCENKVQQSLFMQDDYDIEIAVS